MSRDKNVWHVARILCHSCEDYCMGCMGTGLNFFKYRSQYKLHNTTCLHSTWHKDQECRPQMFYATGEYLRVGIGGSLLSWILFCKLDMSKTPKNLWSAKQSKFLHTSWRNHGGRRSQRKKAFRDGKCWVSPVLECFLQYRSTKNKYGDKFWQCKL